MATQVEKSAGARKTFRYIDGGYPFVGNLPAYSRDRLGLLERMAGEADVVGMHFGPFPAILFNRAEHAHSILVEHAYDFDKGVAIRASASVCTLP